ncbi:Uncharacterised protein [uncultured Ruminococcus sp.]|nr:Uncharacterised protein [uncultured Ruminococcus sp.]
MGLPFMGFVLLAVKDNILGGNIYAGLADNIRRRQVRRIAGGNRHAAFGRANGRPDLRLELPFIVILHLLRTNHDAKACAQYAGRFDLRIGRCFIILHIRCRRHIAPCRYGHVILAGNGSRRHIHVLYGAHLYLFTGNRRTEDRLMVVMGTDSRRRTRQQP